MAHFILFCTHCFHKMSDIGFISYGSILNRCLYEYMPFYSMILCYVKVFIYNCILDIHVMDFEHKNHMNFLKESGVNGLHWHLSVPGTRKGRTHILTEHKQLNGETYNPGSLSDLYYIPPCAWIVVVRR